MRIDEAKRALDLKRREHRMAALKLGAVANVRGRKPDAQTVASAELAHENAARAFVAAEADLRILLAGSEES